MIDLLDLGRPDLFAYRVTDVLTDDDVRTATEAFDTLLSHYDTVHLYAEIEDLQGVDARALWLDLVYGVRRMGALRHIGRVAVVTDAAWVRRLARIEARLLPIGRMNVYDLDGRDAARQWARAAPERSERALSPEETFQVWLDEGGLEEAWAGEVWTDDEGMNADRTAEERRSRRAPRFGHTVHRTHVLLNDVAERLGVETTAAAYPALRAVLHALRDRLPDAEAADLAAQFTTLVRGLFYEGYHPGRAPAKHDRAGVLDAIASGLRTDGPYDAEAAARAVGGALGTAVSSGEWNQVLDALPHDVRELFSPPVPA